jgi:uncharacterized protein (DUF1810 family)
VEDRFSLARFVLAQDNDGTYERAVSELRRGRKRSHWMWFVFPQIAGLGQSEMSRTYAISSLAEARAYLHHPILGARLIACAQILLGLSNQTAEAIFGHTDAAKPRSSMTLFAAAAGAAAADGQDANAPGGLLFEGVLREYFGGEADPATEARLQAPGRRRIRPPA